MHSRDLELTKGDEGEKTGTQKAQKAGIQCSGLSAGEILVHPQAQHVYYIELNMEAGSWYTDGPRRQG